MTNDLTPWRGSLDKPFRSFAERRIDKQASLESYRHDRLSELAVHKTGNIDWAIAQRIRSGSILAKVGVLALEQTPEAANVVFSALEEREMLLSQIFRSLAR